MTIYRLTFLRDAEKEWDKLALQIKQHLAKKLRERLNHPRIASLRLRELPDFYKIKLRSVGYRLIYKVFDDRIVVQVIAVGRRYKDEVDKDASNRL